MISLIPVSVLGGRGRVAGTLRPTSPFLTTADPTSARQLSYTWGLVGWNARYEDLVQRVTTLDTRDQQLQAFGNGLQESRSGPALSAHSSSPFPTGALFLDVLVALAMLCGSLKGTSASHWRDERARARCLLKWRLVMPACALSQPKDRQ